MKKLMSMLIVLVVICTALPGFEIPSSASYTDGENIVPGGDFESGLSAEFIANTDAGQKSTLTRVVKEAQTKTNKVLYVSSRTATTATNGVAYDLSELFREKDEEGNYRYLGNNGMFYISAKVRLANEGETAYVRSSIYKWSSTSTKGTIWWGGGSTLNYNVGSDDWTEIGVREHTTIKYYNFSNTNITADWLDDSTSKVKLQFALFADKDCTTAYMGDFYLDDVHFFFVEGANQNTSVDCYESLLDNYDFEDTTVDGSAIDYSGTKLSDWGKTGLTWFAENATISVSEITEEIQSEEPIDSEGVHSGSYGIKVTDRPGSQLGISIELTNILDTLGPTQAGEVYHISAWMKTTSPGIEMDVVPIWGNASPVGNAYLEGNSALSFHVTNEWTQIGFDVSADQYYAFNRQGSTDTPDKYDPDSATWSSLRFNTIGSTDDYYIDDICIWKSKYSVEEMINKINAMPSVEDILPANRTAIEHVRNLYNMFSEEDKASVTNSEMIVRAEEELNKFKTTMAFTCGTVSNSVLYVQPGKLYSEIYEGIKADNGDIAVYTSSNGQVITEGSVSTGMCVKLAYKNVLLQSVDVVAYGDANSDGECDIVDLVIAKKYIAGQKVLTNLQVQALGVAQDDTESQEVTDADAAQIRKYLVGTISEF